MFEKTVFHNLTLNFRISMIKSAIAHRLNVTASAKQLYRDIGVEELVLWIWSGTNHHDISSLCLPEEGNRL